MKKQLKSFKAAIDGVCHALKSEAHLRFHLVAGIYVLVFSVFFDLSRTQWALVVFLIFAVLAAELFNTAVESLCDKVTRKNDPLIKIAKDASAAAVLTLACASVAVGFLIYFDVPKITRAILFFTNRPFLLILFVFSLIISVVFIGKFKYKDN